MGELCIRCGQPRNHRQAVKYCSLTCQFLAQKEDYIARWKAGVENGMQARFGISNYIRQYLFEKYGNKCMLCGWNKVSPFTERIPLEIHHINGNYMDNREDNLQLLCPNCHSLTDTHGSLNKGNGRKIHQAPIV